MNIHLNDKTNYQYTKYGLYLLLCYLIIMTGCTFPGGKQDANRIRVSIQNTLRVDRDNIPIVLTLEQLKKVSADFSLNAFSVVTGKAPREAMIPSQADDVDYDGVRDQLIFLLDLKSEETKEVSILYDPNVKATFTLDVQKLTRAGIFPELNATAAIESDLVAYILKPNGAINAYGKRRQELFSVDTMYQTELDLAEQLSPDFRGFFDRHKVSLTQNPQALIIDVEKMEHRWVIHDFENQENYYVRKNDGQLNLYKSIGLSLNELLDLETTNLVALVTEEGLIGCGGIALWNESKNQMIPLPMEGDYVRIIANGSMRSIVQRIIPSLRIDGETYHLTINTFIYGRNAGVEQHIQIDRELPSDYAFVVGIPKISTNNDVDEDQGVLWSWGTDPKGTYSLGFSLIYKKTQDGGVIETDPSLITMILNPDSDGKINYRSIAIWDGGINEVQSETEFMQELQLMTTNVLNPPTMKFIRSEEQ